MIQERFPGPYRNPCDVAYPSIDETLSACAVCSGGTESSFMLNSDKIVVALGMIGKHPHDRSDYITTRKSRSVDDGIDGAIYALQLLGAAVQLMAAVANAVS